MDTSGPNLISIGKRSYDLLDVEQREAFIDMSSAFNVDEGDVLVALRKHMKEHNVR